MDIKSLKPTPRQCCVCDKPLYGRSDKVFCDIHCKNSYHSDVRKHTKSASAVNIKILKKNYVILFALLGDPCEKYIVKKLKMKELGFNFDVVSGVSHTPYGLKYDIFELRSIRRSQFSWYYASKDNITVLQDKEQTKISPFMYKRGERNIKQTQTHYPV